MKKQRKAVTIYRVHDRDWNGKLALGSCDAFERLTTYYVFSHPFWLGFRTIFEKPSRAFHLSADAAVTAYVEECQDQVSRSQRELDQSKTALAGAEAFYIGYKNRGLGPTKTPRRKRS